MAAETTLYSFPTLLDYGANAVDNLPRWVREKGGSRVLIVTDPGILDLPLYGRITRILDDAGLTHHTFSGISPDPRDSDVHDGAEFLRNHGSDLIVGLGGGSALDGAKGVALMSSHTGHVTDYDDAQGGAERITGPLPPILAIPTTAGTGSEVGRSFVVVDTQKNSKLVVFSPRLMPEVAILDPTLHVGMPPWLTAATGMDALTHNVEALLSKGHHPMADAIALGGVRLIGRSLERAFRDAHDLEARGDMALAAAMGATAFQKGLGVIHSLAHPCSTVAHVHHGLANGVLIETGLRFNQDVSEDALARIAVELGVAAATPADAAEQAIAEIVRLRESVAVPSRLREVGVKEEHLAEMERQALADACHQCNPKPVTLDDIKALYAAAY